MIRRLSGFLLVLVSAPGVALFGVLWYDRYWIRRDCFNSEGRCYVSGEFDVYDADAFVYGWIALSFVVACLTGLALGVLRKRVRRSNQNLDAPKH